MKKLFMFLLFLGVVKASCIQFNENGQGNQTLMITSVNECINLTNSNITIQIILQNTSVNFTSFTQTYTSIDNVTVRGFNPPPEYKNISSGQVYQNTTTGSTYTCIATQFNQLVNLAGGQSVITPTGNFTAACTSVDLKQNLNQNISQGTTFTNTDANITIACTSIASNYCYQGVNQTLAPEQNYFHSVCGINITTASCKTNRHLSLEFAQNYSDPNLNESFTCPVKVLVNRNFTITPSFTEVIPEWNMSITGLNDSKIEYLFSPSIRKQNLTECPPNYIINDSKTGILLCAQNVKEMCNPDTLREGKIEICFNTYLGKIKDNLKASEEKFIAKNLEAETLTGKLKGYEDGSNNLQTVMMALGGGGALVIVISLLAWRSGSVPHISPPAIRIDSKLVEDERWKKH